MKFLKVHNLEKKWKKVKILFEENIRHPSLHTELLEPHWRGIYSFRVDIKYRALYFIATGGTVVWWYGGTVVRWYGRSFCNYETLQKIDSLPTSTGTSSVQ